MFSFSIHTGAFGWFGDRTTRATLTLLFLEFNPTGVDEQQLHEAKLIWAGSSGPVPPSERAQPNPCGMHRLFPGVVLCMCLSWSDSMIPALFCFLSNFVVFFIVYSDTVLVLYSYHVINFPFDSRLPWHTTWVMPPYDANIYWKDRGDWREGPHFAACCTPWREMTVLSICKSSC